MLKSNCQIIHILVKIHVCKKCKGSCVFSTSSALKHLTMFFAIKELLLFNLFSAFLELCQEASSGEVFLLASAALANITFFDTMACEILLQLNAMKILLAACSDKHIVDTPYSRDQVSGFSARCCLNTFE